MSSSVFSVKDNNEDSEHTTATLLPVNVGLIIDDGSHENVTFELNGPGLPSLPGLDEFCQDNIHVNAILNMLSHNSNSEYVPPELSAEHHFNSGNQDARCHGGNGGLVFHMNQSIDDAQPISNDQGCPSSTQSPTFNFKVQVGECEKGISAQGTLLDTGIHSGRSLIGQDQHMTPPITSQNYEGVTNEPNRIGNNVRHTFENLRAVEEPNEEEIDEAFQNVFSGFNQATEKEILAMLDADTLKNCLDHLLAAPLLICNFCHEIFQYLSPFQVHMQTCCNQPRELQQKMDQFAMDQLARSLWKSVFLKELKTMPISHSIMQHEGYLDNELDQLWLSGSLESILRCRDIFIRAAVGIVSRRWVTNAVANEIHRARALKPKQPKKRAKVESETDQSIVDQTPSTSDSNKRKTRGRQSSKNTKKSTETDLAVRGLISDEVISNTTPGRKSSKNTKKSSETDLTVRGLGDETISNTTLYHVTPETPVSDHGISDVMPLLNHSMGEAETPRPMNGREDSATNPISDDTGVDLLPEMDYELDRIVREVPDVDLLEEAAKGFDNLDNASDVWENNATADEPLSENEFVVGKILDRRLLYTVEDFNPIEEDYEYLVSWEGYGEEGNTWEPYEHLKHCTQKLGEYRERLKQKALRCRREANLNHPNPLNKF